MHYKLNKNTLPTNDRSFLYGDGLFETIAYENNYLIHWPFHLERLRLGIKTLQFKPLNEKQIIASIKQKIKHQPTNSAIVRIHLSRGHNLQGYRIPKNITHQLYIQITPKTHHWHPKLLGKICKTPITNQHQLNGLKHANRLDQIMAATELDNENEVGLMPNQNQHITAAYHSNLFWVKDQKIFTACLQHGGIKGTMRQWLLNMKIVTTTTITQKQLLKSDEIWLTNSSMGIATLEKLAQNTYQSQLANNIQKQFDQSKYHPNNSLLIE